jgi:hypothetical protein
VGGAWRETGWAILAAGNGNDLKITAFALLIFPVYNQKIKQLKNKKTRSAPIKNTFFLFLSIYFINY